MTTTTHENFRLALVIVFFTLSAPFTSAAVPDGINYQAYLSDSSGVPIDVDISVTFVAYTVDVGGAPLWSQTQLVSPDNGLFTVVLGNPSNPFPPNLFDTQIYVGLFIAGEEMLPRRELHSTAYSFKSADADTLTGMTATDLDQASEVAALDTSVSSLQSDLSTAQGDLAGLSSDVAGNSSSITSNDGRISTLEAVGSDITSVVAGSGLTGGATAGDAVIALANGGVTAANLAPNAVTSVAIADGSVAAIDLDATDDYTVGGLTTNGTTNINGQLRILSQSDVIINDDFSRFRWFKNDGTTLMASIEVNEFNTTLIDNIRSRSMIRSNASGIGIGTLSPLSSHAVTIPSLIVTGNIDIGRERISTFYELDATNPSCHSHGNLPCFYGTGMAVCPAGKRVIGGGSTGDLAIFGNLSMTAPTSDNIFSCNATYDIADTSFNCIAICARVD